MHRPAADINWVPNKKFKSNDLPADYGPITLTIKTLSLLSTNILSYTLWTKERLFPSINSKG